MKTKIMRTSNKLISDLQSCPKIIQLLFFLPKMSTDPVESSSKDQLQITRFIKNHLIFHKLELNFQKNRKNLQK